MLKIWKIFSFWKKNIKFVVCFELLFCIIDKFIESENIFMIVVIVKVLVSLRFVCNGWRWYYEIIFFVKVVFKKRYNLKFLLKFIVKVCNFFFLVCLKVSSFMVVLDFFLILLES